MAFMVKGRFGPYYEDTGGNGPTVQVPGSRFVRVEAASHSTYFERPDVFNREVGAFLKGLRP
jgi:pimeloyl-ACP methyl ester carboxylesterase